MKHRKTLTIVVAIVLGALLLTGCLGGEPTVTPDIDATVEALVQEALDEALEEDWTPLAPIATTIPTTAPTPTLEPTHTPQPTAIPTMAPPKVTIEPVVLAEVGGVGDTVTDNFVWPQCQKAVFYWSIEPSSYGYAHLRAYLWNTAKSRGVLVIGAGESDMTEALTGEAFQPLAGGEYYFVVEGATGTWTIVVKCED